MIPDRVKTLAEKGLSQKLNSSVVIHHTNPVGGGCIHHAEKINTNKGSFFLKWNEGPFAIEQLHKEVKGLQLLDSAASISTPQVYLFEQDNELAILVLEWIDGGIKNNDLWEKFGQKLAALHQNQFTQYGLEYDNFIGSLPQKNSFKSSWSQFFSENRIFPMAEMAYNKGLLDKKTFKSSEEFCKRVEEIFPDEPAVLIHGDLWSGNFLVNGREPVIFDPAVYYANREIELSFTKLFGGFDSLFYKSYQAALPLEPGFENRVDLYNLYPLLVHLNLFGTSYLSGVKRILKSF